MKNLKSVFTLFVFILLISGCSVVPLGLSYSSSPLENNDGSHRKYEVLGKAEGSQGYFTLFSLIPFGSPDLSVAISDATKKLNGDALVNVRYWYRVSNYFIGTYSSIEVEGDVIKFKQQKEN
ncbi:MAG: hypothetical protein Q8N03_03855 [Ignavibacteria bacterium]|nr:hypothetical protein [Ignavibacteria bacterium]